MAILPGINLCQLVLKLILGSKFPIRDAIALANYPEYPEFMAFDCDTIFLERCNKFGVRQIFSVG